MSLRELPPQLFNIDDEHCFQSALGLTLAHYHMLGSLTLSDIVAELHQPDEAAMPMARGFAWLGTFGLKTTYIELLGPEDVDFADALVQSNVAICSAAPTTDTALAYAQEGKALITQINHEQDDGSPDWNLNHVVYLGDARGDDLLVVDPNGALFAVPEVESFWGRYPNLIVVEPA